MLDIDIKEDKLKKDTEEYLNIFYLYLLFSSSDVMEMEFDNAIVHEDKILLVTEKTTQTSVFDGLNRGVNKFKTDSIVEKVYIDHDYLLELGNNNELKLEVINNENEDGSKIKYQLSWAKEDKIVKMKLPRTPLLKEACPIKK